MSTEMICLNQLFMLHRLIDLGLDEYLADSLRDEMDATYRLLSEEQIHRLDQVSARLNAERDVDTAIQKERIKELDGVLQHLFDAYWKNKEASNSP